MAKEQGKKNQGDKTKKELYTLTELSELLGIKEGVLKEWCERGEIACVREVGPNGVVYAVREEDVERVVKKAKEWIADRKATSSLLRVAGVFTGILAWLFFVGGIFSEGGTLWAMTGIFFLSFVGLMVASNIISPQKEYRRRKRDDWWEDDRRNDYLDNPKDFASPLYRSPFD